MCLKVLNMLSLPATVTAAPLLHSSHLRITQQQSMTANSNHIN